MEGGGEGAGSSGAEEQGGMEEDSALFSCDRSRDWPMIDTLLGSSTSVDSAGVRGKGSNECGGDGRIRAGREGRGRDEDGRGHEGQDGVLGAREG